MSKRSHPPSLIDTIQLQETLENIEGKIKNGQSRETRNWQYRVHKTKTKKQKKKTTQYVFDTTIRK